jgi:hypothetical protein
MQSLETRRLAVAAALRAVAVEAKPLPPVFLASERVASEPLVDAVVDAVDARLDAVSGRLDEVIARLDSVETALLEAAWERSTPVVPTETYGSGDATEIAPAMAPVATATVPAADNDSAAVEQADEDGDHAAENSDDGDSVVTVPALALGGGRMSSVAAKALFGH